MSDIAPLLLDLECDPTSGWWKKIEGKAVERASVRA